MLDVTQMNMLSRFVKMVDQFYDHRVRLIMTAETSVYHLFDRVFEKEKEINESISSVEKKEGINVQKKDIDLMQKGRLSAMASLVFSCKRTQSRLVEMTGKDYLEKHASVHNDFQLIQNKQECLNKHLIHTELKQQQWIQKECDSSYNSLIPIRL